MRIIFMGSSKFSLPTLKTLYKEGYELMCVVTTPDKPKGRGLKITPPPVKEWAREHSLRVFQPDNLKKEEVIQFLRHLAPQVIVVVAYGKILPGEILKLPPLGCINLHPSLLPELRGPGAIPWSILLGKEYTGVTTILMDEGIDTGDILLQEKERIYPEDTAETLGERLACRGAKLVLKTLKLIQEKRIQPKPQKGEVSYAPLLKKEDGRIDWSKKASDIHNLIRALNPWPSAFTFYEGTRIKIYRSSPFPQEKPSSPPGTIEEVSKEGVGVSTGGGVLKLLELQREGKKRMGVEEFLRGFPLKPGTRFT